MSQYKPGSHVQHKRNAKSTCVFALAFVFVPIDMLQIQAQVQMQENEGFSVLRVVS